MASNESAVGPTAEQLLAAIDDLEQRIKALEARPLGDFPNALDLGNPQGNLLHIRGESLDVIERQLIDWFGEGAAAVELQSFSPAFLGTLAAGGDINAALDKPDGTFAADSDEALAYEALKQAPTRRSGGKGGSSGGSSGGGGPQAPRPVAACFNCGSTDLYDNREKIADGSYKKNAPPFKCKDCDQVIGLDGEEHTFGGGGGSSRRGSRRSD